MLPWRDVLHEGPVPALEQDELRRLRASQAREDRPFMGDSAFRLHLDRLAAGPWPLLAERDGYTITEAGLDVLAGRGDHVRLNGIDRWLGGVHLSHEGAWRWDPGRRRLSISPSQGA